MFDRKARPKTGYWKQHSIAKQNSFKLPHPTREVHHYDMRLVILPCPVQKRKGLVYWVPMKMNGYTIVSCSLQSKCAVDEKDGVLCLKGKRFAGAKT